MDVNLVADVVEANAETLSVCTKSAFNHPVSFKFKKYSEEELSANAASPKFLEGVRDRVAAGRFRPTCDRQPSSPLATTTGAAAKVVGSTTAAPAFRLFPPPFPARN